MTNALHTIGTMPKDERFVRAPRKTDALGHALRGAFLSAALPNDLEALLRQIDRVPH